VSKLLKVWETRQVQHAARAGGLGLLAVSLAACGSSDDTPYSQAEVDALQDEIDELTTERDDLQQAIDDATAAIEAAGADDLDDLIAQRDALQDDVDDLNGEIAALQADYDELLEDLEPFSTALLTVNDDLVITLDGDDALTATHLTLLEGDVVIDVSDTDDDTLTISATGDISHSAVVQGYENITINNTSNIALTHALDGIADGTVTINNSLSASATDATVTGAGDITVVAGTGVTGTIDVTMVAGVTTVVNSGEAANVIVTAGAAADTITVIAADDIDLTPEVANTLLVSGTGDVTLNANTTGLNAVGSSVIGAAGQNLTVMEVADVSVAGVAASISGFDTVTFAADTGILDATLISSDIVLAVTGAGNDLTVLSSADITLLSGVDVTLELADDLDVATNSATGIANVTLAVASTFAGTGSIITLGAVDDVFGTLNVTANADQVLGTLVVTAAGATVNLTGSADVTLGAVSAAALNAALFTGDLVAAASLNLLSITAGAGDDTITAFAGATVVGGAGSDTLTLDANMTGVTFSGFETLTTDVGVDSAFLSSQLNGLTASVVTAIGADLNIGNGAVNSNTINLSGLTFVTATDGVDMTGATQDTTVILGGSAMIITGSNGADILLGFGGADVISGGLGNDTITGGAGADNLTGGAGQDVFVLNSKATTDTVTDFVSADDAVQISTAAIDNTAGDAAGALGNATAADFAIVADETLLTGLSLAATTNAEAFIYVQSTGSLYLNDSAAAGVDELIMQFTAGTSLVVADLVFVA
jgi:Ca2+-binding RTX toxin-like protein